MSFFTAISSRYTPSISLCGGRYCRDDRVRFDWVFILLEGFTWNESIYIATQTVTTVGYGDITPRTMRGQLFATVFMLVGVGTVLYCFDHARAGDYSVAELLKHSASGEKQKKWKN